MRNRVIPWFLGPGVGFLVGLEVLERGNARSAAALGGTVGVLAVTSGFGLLGAALLVVHEAFRERIVAVRARGESPRKLQVARAALYLLVYPILFLVLMGILSVAFL